MTTYVQKMRLAVLLAASGLNGFRTQYTDRIKSSSFGETQIRRWVIIASGDGTSYVQCQIITWPNVDLIMVNWALYILAKVELIVCQ